MRSIAVRLMLLSSMLMGSTVCAADFARYRGFVIGEDLATAAKQAGKEALDARVLHKRPVMIHELEWQLRTPQLTDPGKADPVRGGVLCFLDGKLYRIVVPYDRYRIEGMTTDDLIDAISATYGRAERPETEIAFHSNYGEAAKVLARWQDAQYAYDLVRTGDRSSFALVLYSKPQDALAQSAIAEAARLDVLDAPQRAQEVERKRLSDEQMALEKARVANRPNFRP